MPFSSVNRNHGTWRVSVFSKPLIISPRLTHTCRCILHSFQQRTRSQISIVMLDVGVFRPLRGRQKLCVLEQLSPDCLVSYQRTWGVSDSITRARFCESPFPSTFLRNVLHQRLDRGISLFFNVDLSQLVIGLK